MDEAQWTLDELVAEVAAALPSRPPPDVVNPATADGVDGATGAATGAATELVSEAVGDLDDATTRGGRNGRVREVPDARTIRWYQSTGMVDRPSRLRGRTGLYERRHLLQVLAIKRLQAQGLALADIQAQLLGADDATLEGLAEGLTAVPATSRATVQPPPERRRFWADSPVVQTTGQGLASSAEPDGSTRDVEPVAGVRLDEGVTIVLERPGRPLTDTDLAALRSACAPLLDVLRTRRLLNPTELVTPKESE